MFAKIKGLLVIGNVALSGFVAFFASWFFAEGGMGDATALTPEFFIIFLMWGIGTLLIWKLFAKSKLEDCSNLKIIFSNLLLWVTIPIGFIVSHFFI